MPLSELYRMAKGKLDSNQEKNTTCSTDLSFLPENDLFELVWENGQILKQGQSSRARKSPTSNSLPSYCLPSHTVKTRDKDMGNGNSSKVGKFGVLDSVLSEIPISVPSSEIDLSQDDDMMPWLNYPIDEPIQHEYCSQFLPEFSGVTVNEPSTDNNVASVDKRNSSNMVYRDCHTDSVNDGVSLGMGDVSKVSQVGGGEATISRTSFRPLHSLSQQCQTSLPSLRPRVSDVAGNNTSNVMNHSLCGDSTRVASTADGFHSIQLQKKDPRPPSNNSNLMNFSHFSRPAALMKANLQNIGLMAGSGSSMQGIATKDKGSAAPSINPPESTIIDSSRGSQKESSSHCQPVVFPFKVDLKPLDDKPVEEPIATTQSEAVCQGGASKNDKTSDQVLGGSATKKVRDCEKTTEPVPSSSVCSGNSVERASDDPTHNLKRKGHDTEESECHSEEQESVGAKKTAPARGGTGSKRSRAAEVHNLSERRRRDRINEKMRALQELIPNCNKVDKASMLDEAIEYLKTLQFQVQIMSMGAGLYMPPMMLPTGMQHMGRPHMAHFSPMGLGMGMGMGFGMGMPDMNGGSTGYPMIQVPPVQGAHLPGPPISGHTAFHGMAGSNLQMFGLSSQVIPMSMPRAPVIPPLGGPLMKSVMGLNACGVAGHMENVDSALASTSKDQMQTINPQVTHSTCANSSTNETSNQCPTTKSAFESSSSVQNNGQPPDVTGNAALNCERR